MTEETVGIKLPARTIPPPRSISPQAQAMLSHPIAFGNTPEPDPADTAAWEKRIRDNDDLLKHALAPKGDAAPDLAEHRLSHATLFEIEPRGIADNGKVLYFVHGGGYTFGGGIAAAYAAFGSAQAVGVRTYSIDYRMPPAWPFPAGLDDALEGYRHVVDRHGTANVVVVGQSAGAGLAAAALLKARDQGMALPAACVLHSPEADLTESGDSFNTNQGLDPLLPGRLPHSIRLYAGDHDLRDPYLSPVFGDYTAFPPFFLTTGTRDLFLSNTVLLHAALRRFGVAADLYVGEAMGHGGFLGTAPEDHAMLAEQIRFIRTHLKL
jgi:epsilon-lactone hydrolase